jgi:hypothetical protein
VTGNATLVDALLANDVAELYTPRLREDPCPAAFVAEDAGALDAASSASDAGDSGD